MHERSSDEEYTKDHFETLDEPHYDIMDLCEIFQERAWTGKYLKEKC